MSPQRGSPDLKWHVTLSLCEFFTWIPSTSVASKVLTDQEICAFHITTGEYAV